LDLHAVDSLTLLPTQSAHMGSLPYRPYGPARSWPEQGPAPRA